MENLLTLQNLCFPEIMDRNKLSILVLILLPLIIAVAAGCSRPEPDARLTQISGIVSDDPKAALAMLDSVDTRQLSDADRHYHDFLSVKARDKAYVTHESDSLVLDVIDYYSSRPGDPVYAEALYYGGRVYTDLGDYPTALRYYQKALDTIDAAADTTDLKGRLNSQIGMLFETLRLYDKAKTYYKTVLKQKIEDQDSVGIVYTLQRLGGICYKNDEQEQADSFLTKSLDYSVSLQEYFPAMSRVYLAAVKQEKGDLNTALSLIQNTPEEVKPISRNVALAYAADIYLAAGIMDTAYMYAHELVTNDDITNKKTGYRILTSPEFRVLLNPDTLSQYFTDYKQILEDYFDDNRNELALLQKSRYDYSLHERESEKAHRTNDLLMWVIVGCVLVMLFLAVAVLYVKYRNKSNIVRLHEALISLEQLRHQLEMSSQDKSDDTSVEDSVESDNGNSEHDLRQRLRRELMDLYESSGHRKIPQPILESDVYSEIQSLLMVDSSIKGELWNELERTVSEASPNFNRNLELLAQTGLTKADRQAALLIKCGFRPSEMKVLLGVSNGAVVSRRDTLGRKLIGRKENADVVTGIIRLL